MLRDRDVSRQSRRSPSKSASMDVTPHIPPRKIFEDLEFLEELARERDAEIDYWVQLGLLHQTKWPAECDKIIETLRERPRHMRHNRSWLLRPVGDFEFLSLPYGGRQMHGPAQGELTSEPDVLKPERDAYLRAIEESQALWAIAARGSGITVHRPENHEQLGGPEAWRLPVERYYSMLEGPYLKLLDKVLSLATDAELYSLGVFFPGEGRAGLAELRRRFAGEPPGVNPLPKRTLLLEELHLDEGLRLVLDKMAMKQVKSPGGKHWWHEGGPRDNTLANLGDDGDAVKLPRSMDVASERVDGCYEVLSRIPVKAARNGRVWAAKVHAERCAGNKTNNWYGYVLCEARGLMKDFLERSRRVRERELSLPQDVAAATRPKHTSDLQGEFAIALQQLSRDQGRVLMLRILGGPSGRLTQEEVARVLNVTVHQVRTLETEAKDRLARHLEPQLEGWGVTGNGPAARK